MTPETREKAIEDLKMFHGIPPHDGFSIVAGDGYFAKSLVNKYHMDLKKLAEETGFNKIRDRWMKIRQQFIDAEKRRISGIPYCTVCGLNPVNPDDGQDTCDSCLRHI